MMRFAAIALYDILRTLGVDEYDSEQEVLAHVNGSSALKSTLFQQFKERWADLGDNLSYLYAGTSSSTANITKTGRGGIFGTAFDIGLTGVYRYYQ